MATTQTFLGLDFGTEYIRVTRTRFDPAIPNVLNPQLVEFDGRSSLRNAILFTADRTAIQEFGEEVFTSDLARDMSELVRRYISLDDDPNSELGQAATFILEHIYHVLELDRLSSEERASWRTLVALPIGSRSDAAVKWVERLGKANFPSPLAMDSAQAIIASYRRPLIAPGLYMILDCGASCTRVTLCELDARRNIHVRTTKSDRPGGREFDRILAEYFAKLLTDSTVLSSGGRLELAYFVERFKKQFAREWSQGKDSHEARYSVPSAQMVLTLRRSEFESAQLAGELVSGFRNLVLRTLNEQRVAPGDLSGILLAGGGAHWPFVKVWAAEAVGPNRVHLSEYPEEAAVRGLAYLVVASQIIQPSPKTKDGVLPLPPLPPPPLSPTVSPRRAFVVELIGGLVGIMGLGWFAVLHNVLLGCLGLLGWWVVLILTVISAGITSIRFSDPRSLWPVVLVWLLGPIISASLAYWQAYRQRSKKSS